MQRKFCVISVPTPPAPAGRWKYGSKSEDPPGRDTRIPPPWHLRRNNWRGAYETLKFPKWEVYADKKGEFRLRLYAANGNLVATTNDGYLSVSAAKKGIESVARAAEGAAIVRNDNLW